jgi:hypothetical protein
MGVGLVMPRLALTGLLVLSSTLWSAPTASQSARASQSEVLGLALFPVPLVLKRVPLSRALTEVAVQVRGGYVLFGAEIWLADGVEPSVSINLPSGSRLGDALHQIFLGAPSYTFEVISKHLIDVYPVNAKHNPSDALNLQVARFDFDREPEWIINDVEEVIPGLKVFLLEKKSGPPLPPEGWSEISIGVEPKIALHLRDVTVRQILNALSEAEEAYPAQWQPMGWLVTIQPDASFVSGGKYSFHELVGVSDAWKREAEMRRER